LDDLNHRAQRALWGQARHLRTTLLGTQAKLAALSPDGVLARGYAVVSKDGEVLNAARQVQPGDQVDVRLRDGRFGARVEED
jgi:exodeoxyribonuclease VII large subunit